MTTYEFMNLLERHADKQLLFEYETGEFVPLAYHITEVKNVEIHSVDCGGRADHYYQTVVQLWQDGNERKDKAMTSAKALKIFKTVDKVTPMRYQTDIFFEWGHGDLRTSVYKVEAVAAKDDKLVMKLFAPAPVCKPKFELQQLGKAVKCC